jgi:uncharacterized protein YndB with AHSA1/START domain
LNGKSSSAQTIALVHVSRLFDASPERVFDTWLDPEKASKFLFRTPTGEIKRFEIDSRVGGKFLVIERRDDQDAEHHSEYREIERPRRLVFTVACILHLDEISRVIINIWPIGDGCELTLTHESFWTDYTDRVQGGWSKILDTLQTIL